MKIVVPLIFATSLVGSVAVAQTPPAADPAVATKPPTLAVYFESGSATIRKQDAAVLDQASRLYTEGRPTVMILTGSTDGVGKAVPNLRLSQQRALAVLNQLIARGIPAERFQILAKGASEPVAPGMSSAAEAQDRRVEIAWH